MNGLDGMQQGVQVFIFILLQGTELQNGEFTSLLVNTRHITIFIKDNRNGQYKTKEKTNMRKQIFNFLI